MSRSAAGLIQTLRDHGLRFFTTADIMTLTGTAPSAATQALRRLAKRDLVVPLKRGLWASGWIEGLDPLEAAPHLTAPWPGYVSLYSALSRYGLVEEIPQSMFVVSSGRAKKYNTPLGEYRVHHLPNHLMWGYRTEHTGRGAFPMAEPEKAFLDLAYLGLIPRSPLGMPYQRHGRWKLDLVKLTRYARQFKFPPLVDYLKAGRLWRPNA